MSEERLTHLEFIVRAIETLRGEKSRGIHSVYSGFNQAFREYFDDDPVPVTTALAQEGKIVSRPVRGGVMLYKPGEAPISREDPLSRMGLRRPAPKDLS